MKYLLLFVGVFFINSIGFGQSFNKFYCTALLKTIENKKFIDVFCIDELEDNDSIIIIDTGFIFKNCAIGTIYGKKLIISHNWINDKKGNIIIAALGIMKEGFFSLGYWCPLSGGYIVFNFKEGRNNIKLINVRGTDI